MNDLFWNNVASNGLILNNRFILPSNNKNVYKTRSTNNLLDQSLDKYSNDDSELNLSKEQRNFFNNEKPDQNYRFRLNALKYEQQQPQENLFENDPYSRFSNNRITINDQMDDKAITNEKLRDFLINRALFGDDFTNRKTRRSDPANKQRSYNVEPKNLLNLSNRDLFHAFRRNLYAKNENDRQSEEILEMFDNKLKKMKNENENDAKKNNKKESQLDKTDANKMNSNKLITNNSNYQPVIEQSQSLTKSRSSTLKTNAPTTLRKNNKWNRVSKSTSFLGNNVSDCIKNCVSQGILHPVQCHSLC